MSIMWCAEGYKMSDQPKDNKTSTAQGFASLTMWTPPPPLPLPKNANAERLIESLTEREAEVLRMVAMGMNNQDIAENLVISERTVRTHVSNILSKLMLENRTQATLMALDGGLADGRVALKYKHRNGEYDPPSEVGGFWMEIPEPLQRDYILIAQAPWGEWRMRLSNGEWEAYLPHRLRMLKARFWGPDVPPWEDEA